MDHLRNNKSKKKRTPEKYRILNLQKKTFQRGAGASEKAKDQSFCLSPAPGDSDAKDAVRHAVTDTRKQRSSKQHSLVSPGDVLQDPQNNFDTEIKHQACKGG
jgi:hypothetical protein